MDFASFQIDGSQISENISIGQKVWYGSSFKIETAIIVFVTKLPSPTKINEVFLRPRTAIKRAGMHSNGIMDQ